jgi:hypothetical protein
MAIHSDRIFQGRSTFPGLEEWFYRTREGIAGPYFNREDAALALRHFIKYCKDNGLTGGRDSPGGGGEGLADAHFNLFQALAQAALWTLPGPLAGAWEGTMPAAAPPPSRGGFKREF